MATARVAVTVGGPSTQFVAYADVTSQSPTGNYSVVHTYVQAVNRGDSSSFEGDSGTQAMSVGGVACGSHSGSLPSGYGNGAVRWMDGPFGVNRTHDSAGNHAADTVIQSLNWPGWLSQSNAGANPVTYARIPKRPNPPGTPTTTNVMPTSMTVSWTASGNNQGSAITSYKLRRWTGQSATGTYVDSDANNLTRNVTGLIPGTYYTFGAYAKNGSGDNGGFSNLSGTRTTKTIAPVHVRVGGVWKYAVPYVKVSGVWKMAQPYVKVGGVWKLTG